MSVCNCAKDVLQEEAFSVNFNTILSCFTKYFDKHISNEILQTTEVFIFIVSTENCP